MPLPVQKLVTSVEDFAEAFADCTTATHRVSDVYMSPVAYYRFQLDPRFTNNLDKETQRKLLKQDVVGYIWGAVLHFDFQLGAHNMMFFACVKLDDIETSDESKKSASFEPFFLP